MSTLLAPLPDHDPLTLPETAAALGLKSGNLQQVLRDTPGRFPGAFRTLGGRWRIPRATVQAVGREMGVIRP